MPPLAHLSFNVLCCAALAAARLANVTVDDQDVRLQYAPGKSHWASLVGQDCTDGCSTAPNPAQAYNHTWHDATYNFGDDLQSAPQTFAFAFNGTCARRAAVCPVLMSARVRAVCVRDRAEQIGRAHV